MNQSSKPIVSRSLNGIGLLLVVAVWPGPSAVGSTAPGSSAEAYEARAVAREVDRALDGQPGGGRELTPSADSDEDFLRRVTFDLTGTAPTAEDAIRFATDPDEQKRSTLINRLLQSETFARQWSRYWRNVIFLHATDRRAIRVQEAFEDWLTDQLQQNRAWDEIVASLLTATGDVGNRGETALIFAHGGRPDAIAAATARAFLGIQIRCANCHDHPSARWKRKEFHELAAYFARVWVRAVNDPQAPSFEIVSRNSPKVGPVFLGPTDPVQILNLLDKDSDGRITSIDVQGSLMSNYFKRLIDGGDLNQDGGLSLDELNLLAADAEERRDITEHYMRDFQNSSSRGIRVDPAFFPTGQRSETGLEDVKRRHSLATSLTSPENRWFAKAYVNRVWAKLLGTGFYMPVDDMGPERSPTNPEVLERLASGFIASRYDVRWLFRAITHTRAYQYRVRSLDEDHVAATDASVSPTPVPDSRTAGVTDGVAGVEEFALRARAPEIDRWLGYTEFRTNLPGGRHANVATRQACLVRADGTHRRVLVEEHGQKPDSWTQFAGWSPDGRHAIIGLGFNTPENAAWEEENRNFRMTEGWLYDSCLLNLATGELTNLTAVDRVSNYNTGLKFWPRRNDELLFLALVDGRTRPYRMDLDGKNKRELESDLDGVTYGWNLSPDGQRAAYLDNYQGFLVDADGSDARRIDTGDPFHFGLGWSPDGQWLGLLSGEHYDCHPHVIRDDGNCLCRLASRNGYPGVVDVLDVPDFHGGSSDLPIWSRDGQSVYYTAAVAGNVELLRVSLDGSIEQLTHSPAGTKIYHPRLSPSGEWLAFGSNRTGVRQLYVMPADGGRAYAATSVEPDWGAMWPMWQPKPADPFPAVD